MQQLHPWIAAALESVRFRSAFARALAPLALGLALLGSGAASAATVNAPQGQVLGIRPAASA